MNALDIILTLILTAALLDGFFKGLTEQVVALVSLFVGIWMAAKFTSICCSYIQPYLQISDKFLYLIVFVLVASLVICVFRLIGKVVRTSISFVMLGWLDRLLGAVFGAVKAALVLGVLIVLFDALNSTFLIVQESTLAESDVYVCLKNATLSVFPYFKSLLS